MMIIEVMMTKLYIILIRLMTETVTLQIPEALYQRLAIAAGATRAIS
ncbi:MAG: hypothetical protein ACK5XC_05960 [Pseudanabaena sp.]